LEALQERVLAQERVLELLLPEVWSVVAVVALVCILGLVLVSVLAGIDRLEMVL
jgi:hypothetical protein